MQSESAARAMAALAQPARLMTFHAVAAAGNDGLPAGEVARRLNALQNTISTQLAILARAEVLTVRKVGTSVIYKVNQDTLGSLVEYLSTFSSSDAGAGSYLVGP